MYIYMVLSLLLLFRITFSIIVRLLSLSSVLFGTALARILYGALILLLPRLRLPLRLLLLLLLLLLLMLRCCCCC